MANHPLAPPEKFITELMFLPLCARVFLSVRDHDYFKRYELFFTNLAVNDHY